MNQTIMMLKLSNRRMERIMAGGFNLEEMSAAQKEMELQVKTINAVINACAIASKNKRALAGLERMNIMDDSTAIDLMLGDKEDDSVKCPAQDKLITRHDCLDYSGETAHQDECRGCTIGLKNKQMLLPSMTR